MRASSNGGAEPGCDEVTATTRAIEIGCLLAAAALLAANLVRLFAAGALVRWWVPVVAVAAAVVADIMSGLVHWAADTWGSQEMPVLGPRFLKPFRVHHINPDDFLRRDPIDCNGDVAMLNLPVLSAALWLPLDTTAGAVGATALVAFAAVSLPTNQVHQWAHMSSPPAVVGWLQQRGLILGFEAHARHHDEPYEQNYCIATGWCNRGLTACGFFTTLERIVTAATGCQPRADERRA